MAEPASGETADEQSGPSSGPAPKKRASFRDLGRARRGPMPPFKKVLVSLLTKLGLFAGAVYFTARFIMPTQPTPEVPVGPEVPKREAATRRERASDPKAADPVTGTPFREQVRLSEKPDGSPTEDIDQMAEEHERQTAASILRQKLASAKVKQKQTVTRGEEVIKALDEWLAEMDRWDKGTVALMSDERGKALAFQESLVRRFRAIYSAERPTREEAGRVRALAEELISAVRTALNDPDDASIPADDLTKQLTGFFVEARASRESYRSSREQIETIVSTALGTGEKGNAPLKQAIRDQEHAEVRAQVAIVEREVNRAREESNKKLAAARADAARSEGELEAERERQRADSIRAQATREAKEAKAKAEMTALRRRARDPEVLQVLAPFVSKGNTQPTDHPALGLNAEMVPDKGPVSLMRLKTCGALDRSASGLVQLNRLATLDRSDRPRWQISNVPQFWRPSDQEFIQKAQDLLNELSPALVEEGLLAP